MCIECFYACGCLELDGVVIINSRGSPLLAGSHSGILVICIVVRKLDQADTASKPGGQNNKILLHYILAFTPQGSLGL